jgi:voltage-gated potassium channel
MSRDASPSRLTAWPRALEYTMTALSFAFIVLLILQYAVDLPRPWERRVNLVQLLIWAAFAIDFFIRLTLAPSRSAFLKHNWIAGAALALPAFRVLNVLQLARAAPSLAASGLIVGGRRGGELLHRTFGARPVLYIGILTLFVAALCSAGMFTIEHDARETNIDNIGDAIWWTAATLTTVGSELYPVTVEGRVLAIFVMVYGLGFAGYLAGTFAAVLLGPQQSGSARPDPESGALLEEVRALRRQLEADGTLPANGAGPSSAGAPAEDARRPPTVPTAEGGRGAERR